MPALVVPGSLARSASAALSVGPGVQRGRFVEAELGGEDGEAVGLGEVAHQAAPRLAELGHEVHALAERHHGRVTDDVVQDGQLRVARFLQGGEEAGVVAHGVL